MVGLCDCNNFFVSCERIFRPDLQGRPVLVLSNNDGCVIARSNEVKALGIKMGTPLFQIRELVQRHDITIFSSNYQLYGDISQRVMHLLRTHLPAVEVYSIDEAFLDFSGMEQESMQEYARALSSTILRATGVPVSIGIAPTKTLAKIASQLCKNYPKLEGCCLMSRPQDVEKVLRGLAIEQVWGVGRRYAKKLRGCGITTAYELTQQSESWIRSVMGLGGVRTWRELQGVPSIEFEHTRVDRQSICVSRSFSRELYTLEELHAAVANFATLSAEKLRKQGSCARQLQVFIATNRHREDQPQAYDSSLFRFEVATESTLEVAEQASRALRALFREGYGYKRAGVILSDLCRRDQVQGALFAPDNRERSARLMEAVDALNEQNGRQFVKLASCVGTPQLTNRSHVSPRYTTQWDEILTVKV